MADLLDSVEVGKEGDLAPRGSGARHWLFPINLASLVVGGADVLTAFVPGFKGKIISVDGYVVIVGAGAGATIAINLEIGTTNLTGGVVTPTLAGTATIGAKIAGTAVTALNEFAKGDNISIKSAAGTVFTAGMIFLDVAHVVLGS